MIAQLIDIAQWGFLLYFIVQSVGYLLLNAVAFSYLWRHLQTRALEKLPQVYSVLEVQITLIVPAHNE